MRQLIFAVAAAPALACSPPPDPVWPSYVEDLGGFPRAIAEAVHTPQPVLLGIVQRVRLIETLPAQPDVEVPCGYGFLSERYSYQVTLRAWDGAGYDSWVTRVVRHSFVRPESLRGRYIIALASDDPNVDETIHITSHWPEPSTAQIVAINRCIQQRRCTEAEIATLGR